MPSDRTIVIERFRDEIGDWRLCVLSPFGGRVHAAWALALSRRASATSSASSPTRSGRTTASSSTCPTPTSRPRADLVMVEPDELEELVVRELSSSALFGARFRENAARALLLPRAYPGKRTPLWQQRLKAQSLLEVAKRYGQFPIMLETYRECLRDVLDLPGLEELLRGLHTRELSLVEVETQRASPFASSLLFDYVATYMYEGDTPNAERRAAALSLDRDLLRELLGQEELRELIDPGALEEVEADLQRTSERTRAANADGLHDVLRAVGDLTADEAQARCLAGVGRRARCSASSRRSAARCAMRIGGEERWIAAEDAGLYRDALGAVPPGGLPAAFLEEVEEPLARLARRYARTHGPFTTARASRTATRRLRPRAARARARAASWSAASCAPAAASASGATPRCCAACGARRWPRCARRWSPPSSARWPASCPPGRAWTPRRPAARASTACASCWCRSRAWRSRPRSGSATCCRAAWAPTRPPGWTSSARAASSCGSGAGALGRAPDGWRSTSARTPAGSGRRRSRASARRSRMHDAIRERLERGAAFWTDLLADLGEAEPVELQEALWDLVWAGEVTNDAFAPAARAAPLAGAQASATPAAASRAAAARRAAGAGALVAHRAAVRGRARARAAHARAWPRCCSSATASSPARPCWPRASPAASPRCTASSPTWRRSARRGAATSSRGWAGPSSRCPPRSSGCAACAPTSRRARWCWRPPTPPTRTGPRCRWPKREDDDSRPRRPPRVPGAYVVTLDAEPVLYVERGGKGLLPLRDPDEEWLRPALEALAEAVRRGRVPRLGLERFDGEPVVGSPAGELLIELGFRQGPRRLTLSA